MKHLTFFKNWFERDRKGEREKKPTSICCCICLCIHWLILVEHVHWFLYKDDAVTNLTIRPGLKHFKLYLLIYYCLLFFPPPLYPVIWIFISINLNRFYISWLLGVVFRPNLSYFCIAFVHSRSQVANTRPVCRIQASTLFYLARHFVSTWQQCWALT